MRFDPRLLALALVPLSTGCYVDDGDFVVFRVAIQETVTSPTCFTEDDPEPLEDQLSSSSYLTASTWVIYYGAGDRVLLDAAGVSIGGEENSDGFVFTGHTVDISYEGIDNLEAKVVETTETTVTMDQSGSAISGQVVDVLTTTCDFLTATPSGGLCMATDNCERTATFAGVKLDADVDTTVNQPNPL